MSVLLLPPPRDMLRSEYDMAVCPHSGEESTLMWQIMNLLQQSCKNRDWLYDAGSQNSSQNYLFSFGQNLSLPRLKCRLGKAALFHHSRNVDEMLVNAKRKKKEYFCPLWKHWKINIWIALQLQVENWHLAGIIAFIGKDFGELQWKLGLIWPTFWAFEKYNMDNAQYVFSTKLVWMYSSHIPVRITRGITK